MVAYYSSKQKVEEALSKVKTAEEAKKIMTDLETRMAPGEWIDAAYKKYMEMP